MLKKEDIIISVMWLMASFFAILYLSEPKRAFNLLDPTPLYDLGEVTKITISSCIEKKPSLLLFPQTRVLHNIISGAVSIIGKHLFNIPPEVSVRSTISIFSSLNILFLLSIFNIYNLPLLSKALLFILAITNPLYLLLSISSNQQAEVLTLLLWGTFLTIANRQNPLHRTIGIILLALAPLSRPEAITFPIVIYIFSIRKGNATYFPLAFIPTLIYTGLSIIGVLPHEFYYSGLIDFPTSIINIKGIINMLISTIRSLNTFLFLSFIISFLFIDRSELLRVLGLCSIAYVLFTLLINITTSSISSYGKYWMPLIPISLMLSFVSLRNSKKLTYIFFIISLSSNLWTFKKGYYTYGFHPADVKMVFSNETEDFRRLLEDYVKREDISYIYLSPEFFDPLMFRSCIYFKKKLLWGPIGRYIDPTHLYPYYDFDTNRWNYYGLPKGSGILLTKDPIHKRWRRLIKEFPAIGLFIFKLNS